MRFLNEKKAKRSHSLQIHELHQCNDKVALSPTDLRRQSKLIHLFLMNDWAGTFIQNRGSA
jgi:hypothetical protein